MDDLQQAHKQEASMAPNSSKSASRAARFSARMRLMAWHCFLVTTTMESTLSIRCLRVLSNTLLNCRAYEDF